jgi:hypothetical protein
MSLKTEVNTVIMTQRPYVDLKSSLLNMISKNLQDHIREPIDWLDPIGAEIMKSAWKAEVAAINHELIQRN